MVLVDHEMPKGHAPVTREMLKNVGYKKSRPKKYRNPRKHYRFKAAAALMKIARSGDRELRSEVEQFMKQPKRVNPSQYTGEKTGIKATAIRSRDLTGDIDPNCKKGRDYAREYKRMRLPRIVRGDKGKPERNPLDKQEDPQEGVIRSFAMDDKGRMRPAEDDAAIQTDEDDSSVSRPDWM